MLTHMSLYIFKYMLKKSLETIRNHMVFAFALIHVWFHALSVFTDVISNSNYMNACLKSHLIFIVLWNGMGQGMHFVHFNTEDKQTSVSASDSVHLPLVIYSGIAGSWVAWQRCIRWLKLCSVIVKPRTLPLCHCTLSSMWQWPLVCASLSDLF